jgi:hypothetical protein
LRTTIATCDAQRDAPQIAFEPVPTELVAPRARNYGAGENQGASKGRASGAAGGAG